jgi:hypothetical protein
MFEDLLAVDMQVFFLEVIVCDKFFPLSFLIVFFLSVGLSRSKNLCVNCDQR